MKKLFIIGLLLIPVLLFADVDTKDGVAITENTDMDGFTGTINTYDGQTVVAAGCDTLQENNASETDNGTQVWGNNANNIYFGTRFTYSGADATPICRICLYVEKVASPTANTTVAIYGDLPGEPDEGNILGTSDVVAASLLPAAASPDWYCWEFSTPTSNLSNATVYWVVGYLATADAVNYIDWSRDNNCTTEETNKSPDGATWTQQSATQCQSIRLYSE